MSKHTPGPWSVELVIGGDYGWEVLIDTQEHGRIAECFWIGDQQRSREDMTLANARLIAAAPELLAALDRLRQAVHFGIQEGRIESKAVFHELAAAHEAIAKAEGHK